MSDKFSKIYDLSIKDPEKFWQEAANDIFWFKKPTKILNKSNPPFYKWYEDGITNTCYNALDFHIDQGNGKRTALIYPASPKYPPISITNEPINNLQNIPEFALLIAARIK